MKSYHYERISFSSLSSVKNDMDHNRNEENYRQIIDRMAAEGFIYRGYMPIGWENGKLTDIDLIFEIDC